MPRYNEFRRQLHLTPAKSFADLTDNPVWAEELEEMYGDVERVDLQIGMHAETPPEGLRLQRHGLPGLHPDGVAADQERPVPHRLLHRGVLHARPGMKWIADNTMVTVMKRHYPELAKALDGVDNAFAPWKRGTA